MTYAVPGPIRTHQVSSSYVGGADSPFTRTAAVLEMMKGWEIMKAVTLGTEYLRENSEAFFYLKIQGLGTSWVVNYGWSKSRIDHKAHHLF